MAELEKYQEVERSIIKNYRGRLWAPFIKALKEFELIKPNDKICVCISGGKDSILLAKLFQELKRHSDFEFEAKYLVMNPGYNEANLNLIKSNLELLHIDCEIVNTDIFEIANSQTESPCYLCAKMRRGALYNIASKLGCNKIALGHHFDDVIETALMNMLNVGSFQAMLPKLHSTNHKGMELIRPLYFIREKDIIAWKNYNNLNFIQCACKFTEKLKSDEIVRSMRLETKKLIKELEKNYNPVVAKNIYKATTNVYMDKIVGYKKGDKYYSFLDDYDEEDAKE